MRKDTLIAAVALVLIVACGCRYSDDLGDPLPDSCADEMALEDDGLKGSHLNADCKDYFESLEPHTEFFAISRDADGDGAFNIEVCNKTPHMRFVLRPCGGFRYCVRYMDVNGDIRVFCTARNLSDFRVAIVLADRSEVQHAWVSSFYHVVVKLPFRYKKLLSMMLELDYANVSDLANATTTSDIRNLCKTVALPVLIETP